MLSIQNALRDIKHPLVSSLHMRKDVNPNHKAEDVLVIDTNFPSAGKKASDSYLLDLLLDLQDLKDRAENKVGKFDRVDIRVH